ncbi:hypothetical protein M0804_000743 [Polistes exclamans]|nr:hypothetical protein M0804_000743 [Polistes exclamans]
MVSTVEEQAFQEQGSNSRHLPDRLVPTLEKAGNWWCQGGMRRDGAWPPQILAEDRGLPFERKSPKLLQWRIIGDSWLDAKSSSVIIPRLPTSKQIEIEKEKKKKKERKKRGRQENDENEENEGGGDGGGYGSYGGVSPIVYIFNRCPELISSGGKIS